MTFIDVVNCIFLRIELRMDDLHEYEQMKKQQEKRKCGDISDASFLLTNNIANLKSRVQQQREAQHERIGNLNLNLFVFFSDFDFLILTFDFI